MKRIDSLDGPVLVQVDLDNVSGALDVDVHLAGLLLGGAHLGGIIGRMYRLKMIFIF